MLVMGWRQIFFVVAILSLCVGLAFFLFREKRSVVGQSASKRALLRRGKDSYLRVFRTRNILVISLVQMVGAAGGEGGVNQTYIGPHLVNDFGLNYAVVGIALGAAYLLWLFQRTMLGEVKEKNQALKDLSWREILVFAPLVVWAFWIGFSPQPYFKVLERPVARIVERVHPGYYAERNMRNPIAVTPTAQLR